MSFILGSGGGFTFMIDSTDSGMWCGDDDGGTYKADDFLGISKGGAHSSDARYDHVNGRRVKLISGNTAQRRYEIAAYLVSHYPEISAPLKPSNAFTDKKIQTAIWEIVWNNSAGPHGGIQDDRTDRSNIADVLKAVDFVNSSRDASLFNSDAVVSGGLDSLGNEGSPELRTHIVELHSPATVPEPTSVVLFGSLVVSFFAVTRRARAKRVRNMC
jgi:hypothetical protein